MSDYQTVLLAAKQLSDEDRLRLLEALADTMPEAEDEWPADMDAELERRIERIEQGDTAGTPWTEIRDEALASLKNEQTH